MRMTAIFRWPKGKPWGGAEIGDKRTVWRLLVLPKCLGDEWRWLGWEQVVQEQRSWMAISPRSPRQFPVRGWRDHSWAVTDMQNGGRG